MKPFASWSLVLLVLVLAACGPAQRREQLVASVTTYNDGVRWERFSAAAAAVPPAEREQFLAERERLADELRITDYELVRVADHGDRADIQVKLTWYLDSEGTVYDTWAAQRWERQGAAWRVVEEYRVRGKVMPGLVDRIEEPADGEAAADDAATVAAPVR